MFLYLETYYVRPGLQDVIDERVRSLHENHATNPTAAAMDWAKFLGDATTYIAFRLWHEREVTFDAAQGAFMSEYNRTRPADAFVQPPEIELFDQVDQAGVSGGASFLVTCDLRAGGPGWGGWESELRERLQSQEGFREYRLYRFLGAENRYLRTEFWDTAAPATAFWREGSMREFTAKLPPGQRPAPIFRHWEVLHQLGSARPRST